MLTIIITVATFFQLLLLAAHRQINELVGTIALLFFLPLFTPRKLLMPDASHMRVYNGSRIDVLLYCMVASHKTRIIVIVTIYYIDNINTID